MYTKLKVTRGPMKEKVFEFSEHDSFLVGRSESAACCIQDDKYVSRNHFLLEINPPVIWLRDLNSKNGTWVNDKKYDAKNQEVELFNGDVIRVGKTEISVEVNYSMVCQSCGSVSSKISKEEYLEKHQTFECRSCVDKARKEKEELEKAQIAEQHRKDEEARLKEEKERKEKEKQKKDVFSPEFIFEFLEKELFKKQGPVSIPKFPGYEVIRKIGEGGMGAIYLAKKTDTRENFAIKIIKPETRPTALEVERFIDRDMKIGNVLKHKYIVANYEADYVDGLYYIVMYFVDGSDVQKLMEQERQVDINTACSIIYKSLEALDYMHNNNIVHRDIKPPNILLTKEANEWIPKIADFGLAKNLIYSRSLTGKNDVAGSIPYMSPEQVYNFKEYKPVSDVFSMGATLYAMISGMFVRNYPPGLDPIAVNVDERFMVPVDSRIWSIPKELARVIDRAVAYHPGNRYNSAAAFRNELGKFLNL